MVPVWLIVGLGNPGPTYAHHRHNVGFQIVDAVGECYGLPPCSPKSSSQSKIAVTAGQIMGHVVCLAKPLAYMNLSGPPTASVTQFYKIPPSRVVVIHDDLDLEPGYVRLKHGGGAAGHNGLRSLISTLGPDFTRIRVGIGHPGVRDMVSDYVLSPFLGRDKAWLESVTERITTGLPLLLSEKSDLSQKSDLFREHLAKG